MSSRAVKYGFALALIVVLFYLADVRQLWAALCELTWRAVLNLGLLSVILIYLSCYKWKIFIENFGSSVSIHRLFGLYLIGYFINLLVPSYVGGDAVRSWYIGKNVGQHQALSATILERYTGMVAMMTLGVVFVWFARLATWPMRAAILLMAAGLALITLLALSRSALRFVCRYRHFKKIVAHLEKVQDGLHLAGSNRPLLARALAASFVFHSFTVVNTLVAAWAVGWENPPIWELFVALPIILLIGSLPVSPSGLGLQEGAFMFFLSGLGATPAQALGVGVILRAKSYVLAVCGWLFWLRERAVLKAGQS